MVNNGNGKNARKRDEITCVQLTKDTKNKLAKLGNKADTFESIILGLMKPCGEKTVGENNSE